MKRNKLPAPWFRGYWMGLWHAVGLGLLIGCVLFEPLRRRLFDRAFGDLIGSAVFLGIGFISTLPDLLLGLLTDIHRFRAAAAPHPFEENSSPSL